MRKKIISLVSTDLSYDQRVNKICSSLSTVYDVELCGRQKKSSIPLGRKPYKTHRVSTIMESGPIFYAMLNIRFFLRYVFRNFDIVISNDLDTILAAYCLCKLRSKTMVFDAHEYFEEVPELIGRPFKKKIWNLIARKAIPRAVLCITVNESLQNILAKKYNHDFEVVRNVPILFSDAVNTEKEKVFTILYQGAVNLGRGCELLIEVMKEMENAQVWIVGDGDILDDLKRKSTEFGLDHKIRFFGYLTPEELKKNTARAHVGINILDEMSASYRYSLSNKFFDYMHAGIPSINMDFPEYRKINDKYQVGLLLKDYNSKLLAKCTAELMSNSTLWDSLSLNAVKARKSFHWKKEENTLLHLFSELN